MVHGRAHYPELLAPAPHQAFLSTQEPVTSLYVCLGFGERGMGVGRNEYTSPFKVDHIGFFS